MAHTYNNALRELARLTCWLQAGQSHPSFDVFTNHTRSFLSPTIEVTEEITLKPGIVYNLDGIFLDKAVAKAAKWHDDDTIPSVTIHVAKNLHRPLFSGGVNTKR